MNKGLWIAGVAVLGLCVFLLFSLGGEPTSSSGSSDALDEADTKPSKSATATEAPQLPAPKRHTAPEEDGPATYTRDNGAVVRDHRTDTAPHNDEPGEAPISKVKPNTLVEVRSRIRQDMMKCIREFAGDAPDGAQAKAVLTVSIEEELLRVDELVFEAPEVANEDGFRDCVNSKVLGHEQIIAGAEDVDAHEMTFPYKL